MYSQIILQMYKIKELFFKTEKHLFKLRHRIIEAKEIYTLSTVLINMESITIISLTIHHFQIQ